MVKDHAIRLAIRGLKGHEREAAKLRLLAHPESIAPTLRRRAMEMRRGQKPRGSGPKVVTIAMRVTPETYLRLRDLAKLHKMSMTRLVERWVEGHPIEM